MIRRDISCIEIIYFFFLFLLWKMIWVYVLIIMNIKWNSRKMWSCELHFMYLLMGSEKSLLWALFNQWLTHVTFVVMNRPSLSHLKLWEEEFQFVFLRYINFSSMILWESICVISFWLPIDFRWSLGIVDRLNNMGLLGIKSGPLKKIPLLFHQMIPMGNLLLIWFLNRLQRISRVGHTGIHTYAWNTFPPLSYLYG